jgi:hypothetical protein
MTPELLNRHRFQARYSPDGKNGTLVVGFQLHERFPVTSLRLLLQLLDDEGALNMAGAFEIRDAVHFDTKDPQYTVRMTGASSVIESIYRRVVRAAQYTQGELVRTECATAPLGMIRGRRIEFPKGDISMPLMTLAYSPKLGDLLSLRLGAAWPSNHSGLRCVAARPASQSKPG